MLPEIRLRKAPHMFLKQRIKRYEHAPSPLARVYSTLVKLESVPKEGLHTKEAISVIFMQSGKHSEHRVCKLGNTASREHKKVTFAHLRRCRRRLLRRRRLVFRLLRRCLLRALLLVGLLRLGGARRRRRVPEEVVLDSKRRSDGFFLLMRTNA